MIFRLLYFDHYNNSYLLDVKTIIMTEHYLNLVNYHNKKLYEDSLNADNNKLDYLKEEKIFVSDKDSFNIKENLTKNPNKRQYKKIVKQVSQFKLKKHKKGEDTPYEHNTTEICTQQMEKITQEMYKQISLTIYCMIKYGKLYFQDDYNQANVFFLHKKTNENLTPENSRCIVNCDNKLKILTRYIREYFITPIFNQGLVNTNINRVKKCFIRYLDSGKTKTKLCFESVSNVGSIIQLTQHKFILLDLSNAFNNVTYSFLDFILNHYIQIDDDFKKKNIVESIVKLIAEIKFKHKKTKTQIGRNKGIPQGSAVSVDLFVLCMDFIIKEIINNIGNLGLKYNRDYKIIIYVDDILFLIKNHECESQLPNIVKIFVDVMDKYHFKMNSKKSKKSPDIDSKYCDFDILEDDEKYLGIYYQKDPSKYLKIIEGEICQKWIHNPNYRTLKDVEEVLKAGKVRMKNIKRLRGKLQYRLRPFAKTVENRFDLITQLGYPHIAKALFKTNN